ncbi:hypothetical protein [Lactiplantibacillus daowaiensis]|uniref:DUF1648 domain-containing protein n=1 Tax=Lactiplantibacillus daowaiensis TaxID=2559918 RepID=A0ABW1S2Y2_9LACO
MLKFKLICHLATGLLFVVALVMIVTSPVIIATHMNGSGGIDAVGNHWILLLEPVLYAIIAEGIIRTSKRKRRQAGLETLNVILANEYRWLGGLIAVFIVFTVVMWSQIH